MHADLERDGVLVGDLALSRVLLLRDSRYPWLVLVPRRAGTREIFELDFAQRAALIEEIAQVSAAMARLFSADKMNVAALGNITPQLHVHVIVRRIGDDAWPGPVWGKHPAIPYSAGAIAERVQRIRSESGLAWME